MTMILILTPMTELGTTMTESGTLTGTESKPSMVLLLSFSVRHPGVPSHLHVAGDCVGGQLIPRPHTYAPLTH